ncbi:IS66 family insertion sequence element accessory protein TnpA [Paenibacillus darwinianus]|uniref:IS66 family insertion sequence element accessory protein TnpA n=1 Tax=Paenibacillus darwinianus TaxID=1380763 RepID=UPI0004513C51|nr:hypothetical protein [Paenibacillus darwinianus]EXX85505.1 hypothetical protein BG52_08285 [Paenibacillus darwinianus]EXX89019.1 hypothetical protein CH50_02370 [Paenibacillus darwinianus]
MTKTELRDVWIARIKDHQSSGERVAAWCERNKVTQRQFWYWKRKLKNADIQVATAGSQQWITFLPEEKSSDGVSPLLIKIGSASIEVRAGFEPSLFAEVVRTLKAIC